MRAGGFAADLPKITGMRWPHPSPALVIACVALAVSIGGTSYAVTALPLASVGTAELKNGSVTSGKIKDGSLRAQDFAADELPVGETGLPGADGAAGQQGPAGPPARPALLGREANRGPPARRGPRALPVRAGRR